MDLLDYVRVLRRGWPVVLAFIVAGLAAGVGITVTTTKIYQANAQLFVATSGSSTDLTQLAQGNTFATDVVQSYVSIANSPQVISPSLAILQQKVKLSPQEQAEINKLTRAQQALLKQLTPDELAAKISADAPLNKVLINLHVTDHDPAIATEIANVVSTQYGFQIQRTARIDSGSGANVVRVTTIHPAAVPSSPITPNKVLNIGLGFVVGLLLGVGVVILRDVLDNTIKTPADFEDLGIPVLGMVPLDKRTQKTPIAFRGDPHSSRSEAYRQLRTNFQFLNVDEVPRIIAVTSAVPGEGKTTTAMNLAAALADAGHRVVLVEADLRRPTIAKTLGLVPDVGFTTVLIGQVPLEAALQNAGRNLAVLTSGPIPPNPSELLISEQAKTLIKAVADHADFTIIDTAPLLPVADGSEVAALADATLVVHRAGKTTRDQAARSAETLAKVGERPVGVVLNMISRTSGRYDYEYNYAYTYRPERSHNATGAAPSPNGHPVTGDDATIDEIVLGDAPTETLRNGQPVGSPPWRGPGQPS